MTAMKELRHEDYFTFISKHNQQYKEFKEQSTSHYEYCVLSTDYTLGFTVGTTLQEYSIGLHLNALERLIESKVLEQEQENKNTNKK